MNADGYRKKAGGIESSLKELLPDSEGRHVVAVVELTFGILLHWIAFGMEKKFGKHVDTHVGLPRELRRLYTSKNKLLDKKTDRLGPGTILVSAEKFEDVRELFDTIHVKYSLKKVWGH